MLRRFSYGKNAVIFLYSSNLSSGSSKFDFGLFLLLKGLILQPFVLGFNNGIILSELTYLNLNNTSESVFSISNIKLGSISLIILFARPILGMYACNISLP